MNLELINSTQSYMDVKVSFADTSPLLGERIQEKKERTIRWIIWPVAVIPAIDKRRTPHA